MSHLYHRKKNKNSKLSENNNIFNNIQTCVHEDEEEVETHPI